MYSKLIATVIGICAFFGMIVFASFMLKNADIKLTTPETAANHKPTSVTNQQNSASVETTSSLETDENPTFYDVENPNVTTQNQSISANNALNADTTVEENTVNQTKETPTPEQQKVPLTQIGQDIEKQTTQSPDQQVKTKRRVTEKETKNTVTAGSAQIDPAYINILLNAETNTTNEDAKRILRTARKMALTDKEIVQGSCWDYINEVYNQSGFPQTKRRQLFNGEYKTGPYADQNLFKPADWLYFVNHSYKDIEHSSLFIGWTNRQKNEALMLTYGGENRQEPARYRVYDLSHVYGIVRPNSQPVKVLR